MASHGGAWNSLASSGSGEKWVDEKPKVELKMVNRKLEVGSGVTAEMVASEGEEGFQRSKR